RRRDRGHRRLRQLRRSSGEGSGVRGRLFPGLLGLHQRTELRELLAAQIVALAALDALEQIAHERRELERVERLRDVVDPADVEAARAVAELGAGGEEDDRDPARALVLEEALGDLPAVEPG